MSTSTRRRFRFARFAGCLERLQRLAEVLIGRMRARRHRGGCETVAEPTRSLYPPSLRLLRVAHLEERTPAGSLLSIEGYLMGAAAAFSAVPSQTEAASVFRSAEPTLKRANADEAPLLLLAPENTLPAVSHVTLNGIDGPADHRTSESRNAVGTETPQTSAGTGSALNDIAPRNPGGGMPLPMRAGSGAAQGAEGLSGSAPANLSPTADAPPVPLDGGPGDPLEPDEGGEDSPKRGPPPGSYGLKGPVGELPDGIETIKVPCSFPDPSLSKWTLIQSSGTGTVAQSGADIVITEGSSFVTGIKREFHIPASAKSLTFDYTATFDPSAKGRMRDAFEVALVDEDGHTLAYTFVAPGRDAFYNHTEGLNPSFDSTKGLGEDGPRVKREGKTVTLDLSQTQAVDRFATVVFRLVNNDGDTTSKVTIHGCNQAPLVTAALKEDTAPTIVPPTHPYRFDGVTSNPTIVGTATDADGVAKIEASFDGTNFDIVAENPASSTFTWTPNPPPPIGDNTVTIRVTDKSAAAQTSLTTVKFRLAAEPAAKIKLSDGTVAISSYAAKEGEYRTFDGTLSTPSSDIYLYAWKLGNGPEFLGQQKKSIQYLAPDSLDGPDTVALTVTDIAGQTATGTVAVTITDVDPSFAPASGSVWYASSGNDDTVPGTIPAVPNGIIEVWDRGRKDAHTITVDWGDGTGADSLPLSNFIGEMVVSKNGDGTWDYAKYRHPSQHTHLTHTYEPNTAATYTVNANINNENNGSVSTTITAAVPGPAASPFIAHYSGTSGSLVLREGDVNAVVELYAGKYEGLTATWQVNWGDSTVSETVPAGHNTIGHFYQDGGFYQATATVTFTGGTVPPHYPTAITILVTNVPPVIDSVTVTPANEGASTTLEATVKDQGVLDFAPGLNAIVDWGDNTVETVAISNEATTTTHSLSATHTYADNGTYTVTVIALDKDGAFTSRSTSVTITNVAPYPATAPGDQTIQVAWDPANPNAPSQLTDFSKALVTFYDPGFTSADTPTFEWFKNATINWGDGSPAEDAKLVVTNGSKGTPTKVELFAENGHTFKFDGWMSPASRTVTVTLSDDDGTSATTTFTVQFQGQLKLSSPTPIQQDAPPPKFFIADANKSVYRYSDTMGTSGHYALQAGAAAPVGVASSGDGLRQWVIDGDGNVGVFSNSGVLQGSWKAKDASDATDIAVHGSDLWIVVNRATPEVDKVFRYAGAAGNTSVDLVATASWELVSGNADPTGLATDGEKLWVTNSPANGGASVFVYTSAGDALGKWTFDTAASGPHVTNPTGITLSPEANSTGLWIVDRAANRVFFFDEARQWTSGVYGTEQSWKLAASNAEPTGIGDPEGVLTGVRLFTGQVVRAQAGTPLMIAGQAIDEEGRPARAVLVNGQPADVLDSGGFFFARVTVKPGAQVFNVMGLNSSLEQVDSTRQVNVFGHSGELDESDLVDLSTSLRPNYRTTSFNTETETLYADYALGNIGVTSVSAPLYVGIRNISSPLVSIEGYSGLLDDGTYYYDLSKAIPGGKMLEAGSASNIVRLAFRNPHRIHFTYDVVAFSMPNQPPRVVSPPVVEAVAGRDYNYAIQAFDPEGETDLTYKVFSAPTGLVLNLEGPALTWSPTLDDLGSYVVSLRVSDAHGGSSEQTFVLSVVNPEGHINRPPVITSSPLVEATVGTKYEYQVVAFDADFDELSYSLEGDTGGMSIDDRGLITWNPGSTDTQSVRWVTVVATEDTAEARKAYQTYAVQVRPASDNSPPVFVSTPKTSLSIPVSNFNSGKGVSPSLLTIPSLAAGTASTPTTVRLLDAPANDVISDMDVFVLMEGFDNDYSKSGVDFNLMVGLALEKLVGTDTQSLGADTVTSTVSFGFGVGHFRNYTDEGVAPVDPSVAFTLNLPIMPTGTGLASQLKAATARAESWTEFPDSPFHARSLIEALYQLMAGKGLDSDGNLSTLDNGVAGSDTAQNLPLSLLSSSGTVLFPSAHNGDVPAFASIVPNNQRMIPAPVGDIGGAGFRRHSLPLVIVLSNKREPLSGYPYAQFRDDVQDKSLPDHEFGILHGKGDETVDAGVYYIKPSGGDIFGSEFKPRVVFDDKHAHYAGLQQTVDALVDRGAMVLQISQSNSGSAASLSHWDAQIAALSQLSGIEGADTNGLKYYFDGSGVNDVVADRLALTMRDAIKAALGVAETEYEVELMVTEPAVQITSTPTRQNAKYLLDSDTATTVDFDVSFKSDGKPRAFDLLFVQSGTGNVLGSIPVKLNSAGYDYTAKAVDPDGDSVTYSLLSPSKSVATIDSQTGVITWVSSVSGAKTFKIQADDGRGGIAVQDFTVTVTEGRSKDDHDPEILSPAENAAPPTATVGRYFRYQVTAEDKDGDTLRYYLVRPPSGMKIEPETGLISWEPLPYQVGSRTVEIRVSDGMGGMAIRDFTINVAPRTADNNPPVTGSLPSSAQAQGYIGKAYKHQVTAEDKDGDSVKFDLLVKPAGMAVDANTGWIVWTPMPAQLGNHQVIVRSRDEHGGADIDALTFTVVPDNLPPVITSLPPSVRPIVNRSFEYRVRAQDPDAGDVLRYSLAGPSTTGMSIDADGRFHWTPADGKAQSVTVVVRDRDTGGLTDVQALTFSPLPASTQDKAPVLRTPRSTVQAGQTYVYEPWPVDPDGDPVYVTLNDDGGTAAVFADGRLTWKTELSTELKSYAIKLNVDDDSDPTPSGTDATPPTAYTVNVSVTAAAAFNRAPIITSSLHNLVSVGSDYEADIRAEDADNDALRFELVEAPLGVSLHPVDGTLRWKPTIYNLGENDIKVRVSDPYAGADTQTWKVRVTAQIVPPRIVSVPVVEVGVSEPYVYAVSAVASFTKFSKNNPAESWVLNEPLTYDLTNTEPFGGPPDGMTISKHGVITWTPSETGTYPVTVRVRTVDQAGNPDDTTAVTQAFDVVVHEINYNRAPVFVTLPSFGAVVDNTYRYQAFAVDPNGDGVRYSLGPQTPAGVVIEEYTGSLTWVPGTEGTVVIEILASDDQLTNRQIYQLNVRGDNRAPEFVTTPPNAKITSGQTFRYHAVATDRDEEPVTYRLADSGGNFDSDIEQSGYFWWNTKTPFLPGGTGTISPGDYAITLEAKDPYGEVATQSFTITVFADQEAPTVTILVPTQAVPIGKVAQVQVAAADNVQVTTRKLEYLHPGAGSVWTELSVGGDGTALVPAALAAGTVSLRASATDLAGNKSAVATGSFVVFQPAPDDGLAPEIDGFDVPALLTTPVELSATITDNPHYFWKMTLQPAGAKTARTFAQAGPLDDPSTTAKSTLDPTLLPPGSYTVALEAWDDNGHSARVSQQTRIEGNAKIGNLAFSVSDMAVTASGIPITVTRTYDSVQTGVDGPLGPGWRIEATAGRAKSDVAYELIPETGLYPPFRLGNRVSVVLPDGSTRGFTFGVVPSGQWTNEYRPVFTADFGVREKLLVDNSETLIPLGNGAFQSGQGVAYNPFNPEFGGALSVRTRSGVEYNYVDDPDAPRGTAGRLISTTDRHGNRLEFYDDAIESLVPVEANGVTTMQAGKAVHFEWDASHRRIIRATDPRGQSVHYGYDAQGRLVSATDRSANTTTYKYFEDPINPYMLEVVNDPMGHETLRAKYSNGRVASLKDAAGHEATRQYKVDVGATVLEESVTVGKATTTVKYDTLGRTISIEDPNDAITENVYSATDYGPARDLPIQVKQIADGKVLTTKLAYDSYGDVTATTDAMGGVTSVTYGPFGQPEVITDPGYHSTVNYFDPDTGDLLSTTSPEGVASTFTYDAAGNVESVARGDAVSKFAYDKFGQLVSQTGPTGTTTTTKYVSNLTQNYRETTTTVIIGGMSETVTTKTELDNDDRVRFEYDARGNKTQTDYDPLGRAKTTYDVHGNPTTNYYDRRGLVVQTVSPSQTTSASEPQKLASRSVYDDLGRVAWQIDAVPATASAYGPSTEPLVAPGTYTEYDEAGRVKLTERYGSVSVTLTNALIAGNPTGAYETEYKNKSGLLTRSTTKYDGFGRVSESRSSVELYASPTVERPDVYLLTENKYDDLGRQVSVTTSVEKVVNGVSTVTVDTVTETKFDAAGRVLWTTAPSDVKVGNQTQYLKTYSKYDGDGRVIETLLPDGNVMKVSYDELGRKKSDTDVLGRVTLFGYDDFGRLKSVTQPPVIDPSKALVNGLPQTTAPVTKYDYDASGSLTKITDALGRETTFTFDKFGQQTKRTLPATYDPASQKYVADSEQKFYNVFGDLDYAIDFNGANVDYVYDYDPGQYEADLGRLLGLKNAAGAWLERNEQFDHFGRRTLVSQGDDTFGYGYDEMSRLTSETHTADSVTLSINYGYDGHGRHTSTYTDSTSIGYAYDPFGRLASVRVHERDNKLLDDTTTLTDETEVTTYTYTPAGSVENVTTSASTVTLRHSAYAYDSTHPWVIGLAHYAGASTVPLSQFQYFRAADGQIQQVAESVLQPDATYEANVAYFGYDPVNRLARERVETTSGATSIQLHAGDYTTSYTLDLVGNRLKEVTSEVDSANSVAVTITHAQFDERDRLIVSYTPALVNGKGAAADPTFFQYDKNGSRTREAKYAATISFDEDNPLVEPATTPTQKTDSTWDLRSRLSQVAILQATGPSTSVTYSYSPDGIRTSESVYNGSTSVTTTRHLVDSHNPTGYQQDLELHDSNDGLIETIITGLELLGRTGKDHDGTGWQTQVTSFYLTDMHSGVRQRLSPILGVVAATRYSAFGVTRGTAYIALGATDPNQHLYRGEYVDPVTGAQYLRARWYDLAHGRFRSVDPLWSKASGLSMRHAYQYLGHDPLNDRDPSGMVGEGAFQRIIAKLARNPLKRFMTGIIAYTIAKALIGTQVSGVLGEKYVEETRPASRDKVLLNKWIARYADVAEGDWEESFRLRPDILDNNFAPPVMYEIKAERSADESYSQLDRYYDAYQRAYGVRAARGTNWSPRQPSYGVMLPAGLGLSFLNEGSPLRVTAWRSDPGVILWRTNGLEDTLLMAYAMSEAAAYVTRTAISWGVSTSNAGNYGRLQGQLSVATLVALMVPI